MKLLLDENLSPRLVGSLGDLYPGTTHVRDVSLASAEDAIVWAYAATNGFTIVSKDADFRQRSFVLGHPPKVIWLRRGNCSSLEIEQLLLLHATDLLAFERDPEGSFLVIQ